MKYKISAAVLPLCLGMAGINPVSAQESDAALNTAEGPESDEIIVVSATGVRQNIEKVGVSIAVIDDDLLRQRQTISVADILQDLPGVNITQSGGLGTQTAVRIRGAESDQTLVLINGVRVGDPSSPDGSFDFGNLFAGNIENIEILRGANSVTWGSQAIGGVVNIVTRQPGKDFEISTLSEYGARDTIRSVANISGSIGPISLAAGGSYIETDGISTFSGGTEADPFRQYSAHGRLNAEITKGLRFEASGYFADSRVANDAVFTSFQADTAQFSTAQEIYLNAAVHVELLGGRFKNRFGFAFADINRRILDPDPITGFLSVPQGRTERFEYRGDFEVNDSLRLVFGAETEETEFQDIGGFPAVDEAGIDSIFGQVILTPFSGLSVTAGVRRDDHERFGGTTNFAANLAYKLSDGGPIIRASYAEGFRAPTLVDLNPASFGNPNLVPETAKAYEIGIEDSWLGGDISVGLNLFLRDTQNQIIFDIATFTPNNIEDTRVQGLEFIMELRPSSGFTITGNYTYLDTENRSAGANFGNRLARRPDHNASINIDYQTVFGLNIGGDLRLVGDSFDLADNTRPLDGYFLAGLRASFDIAERFELFGRVENLFDEQYESAANFGVFGRSAFVGLRSRF